MNRTGDFHKRIPFVNSEMQICNFPNIVYQEEAGIDAIFHSSVHCLYFLSYKESQEPLRDSVQNRGQVANPLQATIAHFSGASQDTTPVFGLGRTLESTHTHT